MNLPKYGDRDKALIIEIFLESIMVRWLTGQTLEEFHQKYNVVESKMIVHAVNSGCALIKDEQAL